MHLQKQARSHRSALVASMQPVIVYWLISIPSLNTKAQSFFQTANTSIGPFFPPSHRCPTLTLTENYQDPIILILNTMPRDIPPRHF